MTSAGCRDVISREPDHGVVQPDAYRAGPLWMRLLPPLVMAALGLWRITGPSYWRDEAATLAAVHRPLGQLVAMLGQVDAVHGFYYLVMWPLVRVAGSGEVVTRLPSVLAMAVAAGLVAALGRRLVSPEAGLAAGLIFALLPHVSRYAQEARPYSMVVALAVAASYLLVRAISAASGSGDARGWRDSRGWLAGYAACLGALGAMQAFALLLIGAHGTTMALGCLRKNGGRGWPAAIRARRSLAVAWLAAVAAAILLASPILVLGFEQRGTLSWLLRKSQGLGALTSLWQLAGPAPMILMLGCLMVVAGLIVSARAGRAGLRAAWPRPLTEFCLPWLLLPPAILIGVSFVVTVYTPRYVLYCLPALALLAGAGLSAACQAVITRPERDPAAGLSVPGWAVGTAALITVALLGLGSQIAVRSARGHGDNIRRADQIVTAYRQPGDAVIYLGTSIRRFPAAYPYGLVQLDNIDLGKTAVQARDLAGTALPDQVVRQRLAAVSRVWLVSLARDRSAAILQGQRFTRLMAWRVGAIRLVLYRHAGR